MTWIIGKGNIFRGSYHNGIIAFIEGAFRHTCEGIMLQAYQHTILCVAHLMVNAILQLKYNSPYLLLTAVSYDIYSLNKSVIDPYGIKDIVKIGIGKVYDQPGGAR